jgi:hypothetical protein
VPIWSALRWPFKFLLFSQLLLGLLAGIGLELCVRSSRGLGFRLAASGIPLLITGVLLALRPSYNWSVWDIVAAAVGIIAMAAVAWSHFKAGRIVLIGSGVIGAAVTLSLSQDMGFVQYSDAYGSVGAREFAIDPAFRVVPLMRSEAPDYALQESAKLQAATQNDYESVTGSLTGVYPKYFTAILPCLTDGTLDMDLQKLLRSHLLRGFSVRYAITSLTEPITNFLASSDSGYKFVRQLKTVAVFENNDALPHAWFATNAYPLTPQALSDGLLSNKAPLRSAFVLDYSGAEQLPEAVVREFHLGNGEVSCALEAPQGGVLVLAVSYYPGWTASIDGKPAAVRLANGRICAVEIPPGAKKLEMQYAAPGVSNGLLCAGVGVLILLLTLRRKPAASAAVAA